MTEIQFGWAANAGPTKEMTARQYGESLQQQIETVKEQIGSLWFVDHLQFGNSPVLEGWTALTYLAAQYPQFQVGHMVLCQSFRNPALLAKMAATLQYMSNGRFLLGIGTGWHEEEYRTYNFEFVPPSARIEQLEETLQILKALWTEEQASFQGKHYAVNAAYCEPKPDPLPPIIIGGSGNRMLKRIARYADGWNLAWATPEEVQQKNAIFQQECQKIGRDPAEVRRSWFGRCKCVPSEEEAAKLEGRGLLGTPEQIVEKIMALVDQGIHSFLLGNHSITDTQTVELLAREVFPRVKERARG